MSQHLRHVSIVAVLLLLAGGCGSGGLGIGTGQSISLDQEWQLGDQMAAQVAQQVRFNNDPALNAYVRMVGERLHRATPLADRPFHFYVVDDPSVNAFAIPGGHIYVNSGLIAQADRANMLASVMAHEMSHVVARHVIKQAEQQQAIGAIGSILLGQNPGMLQQLVAQVLAGGAMARFSRSDEKQADDMGLQLMASAGYDPHGMLDMFQKLLALHQGGNSAVARFFADHPGTTDRIHDIENRLNQMASVGGTVDDPQYHSARREAGLGA
ncbi:MAG TPA: M48 family metallopeptidase [Thermoanaerobaculia bacterium]|nr:M48 family metallopeptidase [Thermoanaerobaculia bacterium]